MAASITAGRQRLVRQLTACWQAQALHVAVQLELPDRLATGPQEVEALAQSCDCSADGLRRLLRALCMLRVCDECAPDRYALTTQGCALCREPPDGATSLRALVLWWGGPMWQLWADLGFSVRTGRSARAQRTGQAHYAFLAGRPEEAALFHEAMQAMTALIVDDVAQLPVWRDARSLVDVGGGNGELAAALALAHAALRVSVLDRVNAQAGANALFRRRGIAGRVAFVAGDFFESVPAGADCYLLKSILHNWDDAACARILRRCAEAAPRGARLLVVERVRPEPMRPSRQAEALARTDLNMLAGLGGRERSESEFRALLAPAGFAITGVAPTRHEFSVIEALRT